MSSSADRFAYSTVERAQERASNLAYAEGAAYVVEYDPRQPVPYRVLHRSPRQRLGPVLHNAPRVCVFIA